MSIVPLEEVSFSELLQQPTETAGRLARVRAVKLRRRGAGDLVLMSADRAEQEGEVIDLTARLLAGVLRRDGGPPIVREVLPTVLPWVRFLPPAAVEELTVEFIAVAEAAAGVGNTAPISQLLAEWRHTAEVYADPELHALLTRRTDGDHGAVPIPGEAA
jgi:hypothetical protein